VSTAQQIVSALLESDVRRLIRAGLPRANRGHEIAEWMRKQGWEVLAVEQKHGEFSDEYSVRFKPDRPKQNPNLLYHQILDAAKKLTDNQVKADISPSLKDGSFITSIRIRKY
jgi:hypothetical protein